MLPRGFFTCNKKKLVKNLLNVHKCTSEATEVQCQPGSSLLPCGRALSEGRCLPLQPVQRCPVLSSPPSRSPKGCIPASCSLILGIQTAAPSTLHLVHSSWCSLAERSAQQGTGWGEGLPARARPQLPHTPAPSSPTCLHKPRALLQTLQSRQMGSIFNAWELL